MKLNEVIAKYGNQEVDESKIKEVLGVKESKVWKPKEGEYAYLVFASGGIQAHCSNSETEKFYDMGVVYQTKEEAEFERDKQIFLTKFERYLRENEDEPVDWGNKIQEKYYLYINSNTETVSPSSLCYMHFQGTIYTTSLEALQAFIKDNEADIKKYMFGVE